ncbi:xanthine dehydrogenase family protein molybdopterin-binding subunit [Rhodoferax sediminis]|uniref:Xanthine dehydrogenase family protein molybdopterin-binding subunit n=1 Tax=Rhodoferax sediminis TaxID=2509614 RepID=A0A515DA85_9BURK|nr:xanthine dehydrogenase family protein molybdopterin-binding subunit [Rhodoferax sediminis]QDL37318.1 xanthine dehydrogenase family protein molybdopterin-binding subunit [Rhodoferax sediminis]
MATDTRSETFPFGIAGIGLSEVVRQLPANEPPALAPNAQLQVIGKPVPRQNGRAKVTGATRYTVDLKLPGMLYGRILRSIWPHARIRSVDVSAAQKLPGVRGVVVLAHPEDAASATVRYVGAPLAAVAAVSMAVAEEALSLIRVDAQPLPFVTDIDQALLASAQPVFDSASAPQGNGSGFPAASGLPLAGNLRGPAVASRGNITEGFAQAEMTVEAEYRTQVQTHCCMEPHATIADWRAEGLTVHQSTQFTAGVRQELAATFGLPLARVRVVVDGMGGGFGSKSQLGNYGRIAVMLSRQAGAPVRIALDRREEQTDAGNRPGTWQQLRIGARRDGTLTAISLRSRGTAGVTVGAGVGNNAQSMYECPNFDGAQYDVFTNAGPGCAMRGPGNTPGAWGLEQAIDELAGKLGMDPVALRDHVDASPVRREERRLGAERIGWARHRAAGASRSGSGPVRRGMGMAQSIWGANVQTNSSCEVRLHRDGTVELLSSVQDIGTGIGTVLAQVVAEVFGLRAQDIHVRIGDTEFPAGPPSYGSRTTASITPPARTAAWRVLQALLAVVAPALQARPEDLIARDGRIVVRSQPARGLSFREGAALLRTDRISEIASRGDDYGGFRRRVGSDAALAQQDLGGVQFAAVAVDTETGIICVERVVAVHDCGRPMNPKLIESQVQGGVLMGLSYALFEDRILDRHTSRMVNANLEQYKLAGAREIPAIEVILLENYQGQSATDAYGIAEPANIGTAPAIANAVCDAIGVRLRSLPMTPAVVLAALGGMRSETGSA